MREESDKIIIRPSSVDNFLQCSHQWYRTFILGGTSIPNSRAAIGTAIHRGVEEMWKDSMQVNTLVVSHGSMEDAAMEAWDDEEQKGMRYDSGETQSTCAKEIVTGLNTFVDDIVPFVPLPTDVEQRFSVDIGGHPIVKGVSGTLDYLNRDIGAIADVKTSKRKPQVANAETQQSIYKFLVESNGIKVNSCTIQGVVLKAKPEGHIMDAAINVPKAKSTINTLLDVLEVYDQDIVNPDILFRGNPKYYLCNPKYCAYHSSCKYVGNA